MSVKPYRILIVGAGLTAAVTSALIKQQLPSESIEVHVWEKSRGIGGRMNTNRSPDRQASVDLGAQYITKSSQYGEKHKKYFDDLIEAGLLKPFPGVIEGATVDKDSQDFMAPNGINSVVKHFFNMTDVKMKLNTFCQEINLNLEGAPSNEDTSSKATSNNMWTVISKDGTCSEDFHGIILTIPVPQILQLHGTFIDCLKNYRPSLEEVQYSSRYALALYFSKDAEIKIPWTAKYVKDNPCIRFVCLDSVKRGKDSSTSSPSILVHTSVPFGLAHLDSDIKEIENVIYGHFQEMFPELPRPTSSRCIRWRYSQVYKSFPGQPGAIVVSSEPLLVLAGDGFLHSNFSGCVESANAVIKKLQDNLVF